MKKMLIYSTLALMLVLTVFSQVELCHDHELFHVEDDCFCHHWLVAAILIVTLMITAGMLLFSMIHPFAVCAGNFEYFAVFTDKSPPIKLYQQFPFTRPPPSFS